MGLLAQVGAELGREPGVLGLRTCRPPEQGASGGPQTVDGAAFSVAYGPPAGSAGQPARTATEEPSGCPPLPRPQGQVHWGLSPRRQGPQGQAGVSEAGGRR